MIARRRMIKVAAALISILLSSRILKQESKDDFALAFSVSPTAMSKPVQTRPSRLLMSSGSPATTLMSMDDIAKELNEVESGFERRMKSAQTTSEVETIRRDYLGKKGPINSVMGFMRLLSNEDKPKLGVLVNAVKDTIEQQIQSRASEIEIQELEKQMENEYVDVTKPGLNRYADIGRRHPLSIVMEHATSIFVKDLGYDSVTDAALSPEIETDYYCFQALNCPKDHPSRDMQDTFYLTADREVLLRSQTSSVQIRYMERHKPPFRMVSPGRVYRKDDIDATHSFMFHQIEILAVEKRGELTLGHLKGTVEYFLKKMLGPNIKVRFRGSYFPFTEPSMEVDVFFRNKWMEVLGCGMVDPAVLDMAGIDSNEYTGFAAGFGVERFAMVMFGINDLREFYKNDKRFLQQFPHFYDDGALMKHDSRGHRRRERIPA
jgi:phenylalanyl-tRNA synthetase alpha chain